MKKLYLLLILILISINSMNAQKTKFKVSNDIVFYVENSIKKQVLQTFDQLFFDIENDLNKSKVIEKNGYSENLFLLKEIQKIERSNKNLEWELINFYSIDESKYLLKVAAKDNSNLRAIFTIIATLDEGKVKFSSPLKYRTRFWKDKRIGNVQYFFEGSLNKNVAEDFDRKNKEIAKKFELIPKSLTFYKCPNYEEVQRILGIDFDAKSAGTVQSSEAFDNTIITGLNTENFSHDLFHMYIETKFPDNKDRNFIAEEGYANSIADAYYAKKSGEIISRKELVFYLKDYLEKNPDTDLLELFQKNPRVYYQLSDHVSKEVFSQLSVKSTITSLICDEIEREKGFESLIKLLRSGPGEDAFFNSLDKLIGINKSNFNDKVRKLIS